MILFLEQVFNALALASVYLLVAMGLTLVFGLTRLVLFVQGELVTLGAFVTLELVQHKLPVWGALAIAALGIGVGSEALDRGLFRRTLARPLNGLIISLGLIVALEAAFATRWSSDYYFINPVLPGSWRIGDFIANKERLLIMGVVAVVCVALFSFLDGTHYGRGIRALSENRTSAQLLGVPVGRLIAIVFMVSCGLAALSGGLLGTIFPFTAFFGGTFLLKGFSVAIVGGLGNVRGAIVAALILAFAETMASAYISPAWSYATLLIVMVAIILVRPYGLFQRAATAGGDPLAGGHGHADVPVRYTELKAGFGRVLARAPGMTFLVLLFVAAIAPLFIPSNRDLVLAMDVLIDAVGAYSVWFGFRYGGIFNVAPAAFVGMGAYTAVIAANHWGLGFWPQVLIVLGVGAVGGTLFGFISLRATGSYFVIILLGLAELQLVVIQNWTSFTGGVNGTVMARPPTPLGGLVDFTNPKALYWLVFVAFLAVIGGMWLLGRSGFARRLITIRDNEPLARSLGLNSFVQKLATMTVAGLAGGVAGILYLYVQLGIDPTYFNNNASIQFILMMLLGGAGTLAGPLIGATIAIFLPEALHLSPYQGQFVYGVLLVAIIVLLPRGVVGTLKMYYLRLAAQTMSPSGALAAGK